MGFVQIVGSINMDLVVRVARHPHPGETVLGGDLGFVPGGKGANQAVGAARAASERGRVRMLGCLGSDAFAVLLRQGLQDNGVDVAPVRAVAGASGTALIAVAASGENTIVVSAGANALLHESMLEAALFVGVDVLVASLEVAPSVVFAAARLARAAGARVVLNAAPALALRPEELVLVDVLVVNESEAALLAGCDVGNLKDAGEAALVLGQHCPNVVVTLGALGALCCTAGLVSHVPAIFVEEVVDSTAAGDAFVASLAVRLSEGASLLEAARFGVAAGALACMVLGAQPSLPHRAVIEALLQSHGGR